MLFPRNSPFLRRIAPVAAAEAQGEVDLQVLVRRALSLQ